ncbi:hypothetical protein [Paenibacillus harenae]|uniref:DUF4440 domain-containing protein n=1 Tax=Paenibacillus harenae TaxID=306543 RepID=A0ABT9U136_PAEHA|nr:hypothetical protein [Paenibacillus harenae]MDQ0113331.1 hypothetical protein [Paenibacillus harenae]
MIKCTAITVLLTALVLLTACRGEADPKAETNTEVTTPENHIAEVETPGAENGDNGLKDQDVTETNQPDADNFESAQLINLESYKDQFTDGKELVLTALENNLFSLVEHNDTLYRSGFVNEKLADDMKYYYGEQFKYRFIDIESIEQNLSWGNVHITVLGQRLDTTTKTISEVKMMYAFRENDEGEWMIHTID